MHTFNLKQHKVYWLILATAVIPLLCGGIITQLFHYLLPNWAILMSGVVMTATVAATLLLMKKIRDSLSLEQFEEIIEKVSTPLMIADKDHQIRHVNQATRELKQDIEDNHDNLVTFFSEVIPGHQNREDQFSHSAHLLDQLAAPIHSNYAIDDSKFKVTFKPLTIFHIRIGTLVEFQKVPLSSQLAKSTNQVQIQPKPEEVETTESCKAPNPNEIDIRHVVENSQHAMMILDENKTLLHINKKMQQILQLNSVDIFNKDWQSLLSETNEHVKQLFAEALNYQEKTEFIQESTQNAKSVDWSITPIKNLEKTNAFVIEAMRPSKSESIRLRESLMEIGTRADICEKEIAHFVNVIGQIELYSTKGSACKVELEEKAYRHPLLKKGMHSVQKLANMVNQSLKEAYTIRQHLAVKASVPNANASHFSVLSQALLRNVEELRNDYIALKNQSNDHQQIVNEQKGISQKFSKILSGGLGQTRSCRDKTLAGFEMVTMVVHDLQQFEMRLSAMLNVLEQTHARLQKIAPEKETAALLDNFMQSLTEQVRLANTQCMKNKSRLKLLIPHFTKHHLQMGHIQTQWQNGLALLQTQDSSLSEWRTYRLQVETYQAHIETRLEELNSLSEKVLNNSYKLESSMSQQGSSQHISQHFEEMIMRNGLSDKLFDDTTEQK